MTALLLFFMGLLMLALGGDSFVSYTSSLARKLRVPPLIIGATVAALGTTLPETVTAITAAVQGSGDVALGTAFGSTVCNSCLIGGIGILFMPVSGLRRRTIFRQLFFFLLAACFTSLSLSKTDGAGVGLGIILLSLAAVYALTNADDRAKGDIGERPELICVGLMVSAAALYLGSGLIVDNGILLAEELGLSHKAVSVTFIALGTSMPELSALIASLIRKNPALALGNLIGANILNLMLAVGLPGVIAPIVVGRELYRELAAAAAAMGALVLPPALTGRTYRWQGALLILMYAAYAALVLL